MGAVFGAEFPCFAAGGDHFIGACGARHFAVVLRALAGPAFLGFRAIGLIEDAEPVAEVPCRGDGEMEDVASISGVIVILDSHVLLRVCDSRRDCLDSCESYSIWMPKVKLFLRNYERKFNFISGECISLHLCLDSSAYFRTGNSHFRFRESHGWIFHIMDYHGFPLESPHLLFHFRIGMHSLHGYASPCEYLWGALPPSCMIHSLSFVLRDSSILLSSWIRASPCVPVSTISSNWLCIPPPSQDYPCTIS